MTARRTPKAALCTLTRASSQAMLQQTAALDVTLRAWRGATGCMFAEITLKGCSHVHVKLLSLPAATVVSQKEPMLNKLCFVDPRGVLG